MSRCDRYARAAAVLAAVALVGLVMAPAAAAQSPTMVRIPITESSPGGQPLTLEATLYRPTGNGRYPVLLFSHGSTGGGRVMPTATLRPDRQASFFVERGFAVLAPMRRGRGASDGEHGEHEGACAASVLQPGLERAIQDMDAALAYVRAQPWADPDRVLIGGQSRGGILSVVYAAERPTAAIQGVINFAGGWTGERCDRSGVSFNASTFAAAGGRARVPMLWLYAEEDRYYEAAAIRRYHDAFARAGGTATFHLFPGFGGDGHRLVDRVDLWGSAAEDFLRRLRLSPAKD